MTARHRKDVTAERFRFHFDGKPEFLISFVRWLVQPSHILAGLNVQTVIQGEQQAALASTLDSLDIDACCETRVQYSSTVFELTAPSLSTRFRLLSCGDPEAATAGCARVVSILNHRVGGPLTDCLFTDGGLRAARLTSSVKKSHKLEVDRCPFVVSAYVPTECSFDTIKGNFHVALNAMLRWAKCLCGGRKFECTFEQTSHI
ncbi:LOW QUALITY PROTEIN: hypothetical protein T265_14993 [Opisthorchis viverrini]|uniref:Uncharacterized protein n=1 Tax=Opisthorchis viverrini TaxID=6198 RepID=A0A075A395_OPIVI|nr:LOW QUALITY PROTEIN: hypothetical protein T265_14993 [Opisthorchis viverrini]KER21874.1 LOW QUALITY PROTEIN: hypothetical protein T265_14993 [Opisthorchis viverrini]